jgi:hypothetical protein
MLNYESFFIKQCRRQYLALAILSLFSFESFAQVFPVDTLMRNGERPNRINLVYLSDGYLSASLPTYISNATAINNELFAQTPFKQYKLFFNAFAVKVPSTQAGAKHPSTAADESTSGGQPIANPDNYFNSTFDYFSIHRLLVPQNATRVNNVLASNLPDYDQAFIIVNSPYYGGSGGVYATASTESSSAEVAIHEIGHSFAQLADEYWAGDFYAGEKPNMTQTNNAATVKWHSWYGNNNVGIFPYGVSGNPAAWYRPHQLCKMQYLGLPFCSVCAERFIDRIHQLVNMVDAFTPATTAFSLTNSTPADFSVSHIVTIPSTITVKWYLNGSSTPFTTGVDNVSIPYSSFVTGNNTIRAEVTDNTTLSKSYLPGIGYVNNVSWTVFNAGVLPVRLSNFTGEVTPKNEGLLSWKIETAADLAYFELEKSADGIGFSLLKRVEKAGNGQDYHFTDESLYPGSSYYRLRIFDRDGSSFYSNTILLKTSQDKLVYKVYQDADNHRYNLVCALSEPANISISIADANGRQVLSKSFGNINGRMDHTIDLAGKPAGVYFLSVFIGDKKYNVPLLAK